MPKRGDNDREPGCGHWQEARLIDGMTSPCARGWQDSGATNHNNSLLAALQSYQVQIRAHAHQLERVVVENGTKPITANDYFACFSLNVMGQISYSSLSITSRKEIA